MDNVLHLILPLCSALTFFALGVLVLNVDIDKNLKNKFLYFCYTTFHWQICWFFLFALKNPETAVWIIKIGYSGIIFLPITFYDFVLSYIEKRPKIGSFYALGLLFLAVNWLSDSFIQGGHIYSFGFYPKAGLPWHLLYLLMVGYIIVSMLWNLKSCLNTPGFPSNKKLPIKYLFAAVFIYCLAAGDFLLNYPELLDTLKITLYPFGNVFIMLSAAILTFLLGFEEVNTLNGKLEQFNKDLEKRIEEATTALKKVNHQNQYMVNVFTHDIKNKMVGLIFSLRSLKEKIPQEADGLLKSSESVFRVSANLINVFSKDSIVLDKKPVPVASILSSIRVWESLFRQKAISFSLPHPTDASVLIDPEYMDLVWENLMANAFEHTPSGGFFKLECKVEDKQTRFSFKNTCSSRHDLPDVFKKYSQPEEQNPYNKGLGLHYSKMMVELHGGTIDYLKAESGESQILIVLDCP